ncbi:MAG: hypothetical protein J6U98_06360 [Abditibacteriota bacterium]|nr:hypothetical protein [Abditibacteriota bacterium]
MSFENIDFYRWVDMSDRNPYTWKLREGAPQRVIDEFNEVLPGSKEDWDRFTKDGGVIY